MLTNLPRATIRSQITIPLRMGDGFATTAQAFTFEGLVDGREHLALGLGSSAGGPPRAEASRPTLVRLHSECGPQLREAVGRLDGAGGYLLYLRQEGRGIGLYAKLDAYQLQSQGLDTYAANVALGYGADERDYTAAAQMLLALGVPTVRLLSNNPDKARQLRQHGITVAEQLPTGVHISPANVRYLTTKAAGGHFLDLGT